MPSRPNILHIFVDQQRFDTIHALGNPVIRTPNLDRLCHSGVSFTSAYSPSPVCVSARCSMIHGQYPMNTGCYENRRMPTDGRQTVVGALTDIGYRTHGIGKCHFTPDSHALRGFESRERQEEGGGQDLEANPYLRFLATNGVDHVCEPHGVRGEMYYVPQPSQLPARLHPTQWIGDRSTAFIHEHAEEGRPWYLFSSFIHPHPPFAPPNPWHKLYRAPLMPLPNVPAETPSLQTYVNRAQNRYKYRDQGIDQNLIRSIKAYYYACISFVDLQVGRLLDALAATEQLANTLVLFTSDHGEHLGDYNCFGKRSMHDSCARIPMVVSLPGRFAGGGRCDVPVSLVDVAPTFLGVSGAQIASHPLDGVDLAGVANGECAREAVFAQLSFGGMPGLDSRDSVSADIREDPGLWRASRSTYMAVSKEHKYFYSAPDDREFFFDRITDPLETRNQAGLVFHNQALSQMRSALMEHLCSGGETAGIEAGKWRQFPRVELNRTPDAGLLIQDGYAPWADVRIPGYTD